ncbi:hypothetical protein [Bosea sp. BH3]|uniref:hypothetical protein n=1 Tax=Bosea sp. BH3 TaxID=2871701 RepID=UPI0021CB721B|nr:hypothetical protein [Bosea sp. BH3]MCU4181859.1 hypothetical protein [Bosea sp. BH3]
MIVFDDNEVQAIFHQGTEDILLVTFGPLNTLADGADFFGRPLAERLGLSTLGFMAKRPNWYPEANMRAALTATEALRMRYLEVVTYGASMGGYGAAKYSRRLGASTALSICPQWSIDPDQAAGYDQRYQQHFIAGRTGGAIGAEDVSGRIYVFVDPSYAPDFGHATRIPTAELVPVHSAEHHVTGMLAGTAAFGSLLAASRHRNHAELRSAVAKLRRASPRRLVEVIKKARRHHPQWAGTLTRSRASILATNPRLLAEVTN